MLSTDRILHKAQVLVFEEDRTNRQAWKERCVVLVQSAILVFKPDTSIIDSAEEFKLSLKNAKVRVARDLPLQPAHQGGFEVLADKVRRGFLVHTSREAERWKELVAMAISWSNYEQYCSFQQILPAPALLDWVLRGEGRLVLDYTALNSFATTEFLRGNEVVTELVLEGIQGQVPLLTRTLACFAPTQLLELVLSGAGLSDRGLQVSLNSLANNTYLEVLDLSRNDLTARGVSMLFKVFPCTPSLATLNLAYNPLRDEGISTLFPDSLRELELKWVDLSAIQATGQCVPTIRRLLAIRNLTLRTLKLNQHEIPLKGVITLLRDTKRRRMEGLDVSIELNPLPFHPALFEALERPDEVHLSRVMLASAELQGKAMPRLPSHRAIIEQKSAQIRVLLTGNQVFIEDLCDLAADLAGLEFQFPRSRCKELEAAIETKLFLAIRYENLYCLEKLLHALQQLGGKSSEAEAVFDHLSLEAGEITEGLRGILSPRGIGDLEEMNEALDRLLGRAKRLGMRGELVATAMALQELRDSCV